MRNLYKRIEAIEKYALEVRRERERIVESALRDISVSDLESLISSYGADRLGRTHTESESAARRPNSAAIKQHRRIKRFL
jgi:hypothetical protein